MPQVWPHATMRELLAQANATGEARATLASAREAELFRFAIYSYRRKHASEYCTLAITLDGNNVVATRREEPSVTIVYAEAEI